MTIDTKQLAALADAATPGPWVSTGRYIGVKNHLSFVGEFRDVNGCWSDSDPASANAAFVATANPAAIKELCQRVEMLEAENRLIREDMAEVLAGADADAFREGVLRTERDQLKTDLAELQGIQDELRSQAERYFERNQVLLADLAEAITIIKKLYKGYVNTLEAGYDRITSLGGDCDAVDLMEDKDPVLTTTRAFVGAQKP